MSLSILMNFIFNVYQDLSDYHMLSITDYGIRHNFFPGIIKCSIALLKMVCCPTDCSVLKINMKFVKFLVTIW